MQPTADIDSQLTQALADYSALIVPGLNNSGTQHWQSLWEARLPHSTRIELDDWTTPNLDKWCNAIVKQLNASEGPSVLIAHSFGALASARMAALLPEKIAALFLVAPADPDKFSITQRLPNRPLKIKATLIASTNDPWMQITKAAYWADVWRTAFLPLDNLGHINAESNLGGWPQGIRELQNLTRQLT